MPLQAKYWGHMPLCPPDFTPLARVRAKGDLLEYIVYHAKGPTKEAVRIMS